jgi:nucleoside-diphosphate-sugar epimerase
LIGWGKERGVAVVILRVTGIYGPGRLPLQHLAGGVPLLNETEAPVTNRIHADDLAQVCVAAACRGKDGDIFNVSDGEHSTITTYFNAAADLLGIPRPPQVNRTEAAQVMPPLLFSYFSESRRVDNRRMLEVLGVKLRYPTLADGLPTCLPDERLT